MIDHDPGAYYRARERRERELAMAAKSPTSSAIHLDLATRYSVLVWPLVTDRSLTP